MTRTENYYSGVTLGTDLEFFVADETGEIVSAEGHIRGTKEEPYRFSDDPYFATQLDNVLAEGNVPPAHDVNAWCSNILLMRNAIHKQLPSGYSTVACASAQLHERFLTAQAMKFGCDPSLSAWTGEEIPVRAAQGFVRSAGFHVHVGYTNPNKKKNILLAKFMDLYLGVPAVLVEPPSDRHKLGYGIAGNFRHQKHGVEYRSLSSYFASEPHLVRWVYWGAVSAVARANWAYYNMSVESFVGPSNAHHIQRAINERDVNLAQILTREFSLPLPREDVG